MKDAAMFPLFASGGLFGIYLFFKVSAVVHYVIMCVITCACLQYVPKEYVNLVLNLLFLGLGMSALVRAAWSVAW